MIEMRKVVTGMALLFLVSACGGESALPEALVPEQPRSESGLLTSSCGDNVALSRPVTSSGWWSTNGPERAVDGNPSTAWSTNLSTGAWLRVDLGTARSISRAVVTWGWDTNYGDSADSILEGSLDGTSWMPMKTLTHTDADNRTPQDVSFPAVSARYVRFRGTRWNGGWAALNELQLYENLALSRPVTSSGWWSTNGPAQAVDGNPSTAWSTNLSTGAWLQVDLGAAHDVSRAVVIWGWDTNYGDSADSILEGSLDGTSWMPMKTLTHTDADNRTPQDVSFPAVSARYVRFRGTRWNGGWAALNELQLYGQGVCNAAAATATYDATLKVPRCSGSFSVCDSGSLLTGRAGLGPELNASNTLQGSCADGTSGVFHSDESLDRLVVSSVDGGPITAGKQVKVSATVWVWGASQDFLDLYFTSNAQQPSWQLLGTLSPVASGPQTLEATYVLPAGGLQAVRGQFRYLGSATPCSTGPYDDHDDLALGLECPTWYADTDGDGFGDASTQWVSCTAPAGHVSNGADNCPSIANADQADADGDRVGDACLAPTDCGDLAESNLTLRWTAWSSDNAQTTLSTLSGSQAVLGSKALRAVTQAAFDFAVRFTAPAGSVMNVSGYEQLRLAVRGTNTTPTGWQGNFPVVVLQDSAGQRRTYTPNRQLLTKDGTTWTAITIPLAGDTTWSVSGNPVNLSTLRQVEVHADTWDSGFTLDVDAVSFEHPQTVCPLSASVVFQDVTPPTAPTNLSVVSKTDTRVELAWAAATDNVGVTAYDIYQGSTLVASTAALQAVVSGLTADTSYTFTVKARDAAQNRSLSSNAVAVTLAYNTLQFEADSYTFNENAGTVSVNVKLSAPSANTVTVAYQAIAVTATAGADYQHVSGTLTFTAQDVVETIVIPLMNDSATEATESFNLWLLNAQNAKLASAGLMSVRLVDDDTVVSLSNTTQVSTLSAQRSYQWAVQVFPDDEAVETNSQSAVPVGFSVDVRRGELGGVTYTLAGTVSATNLGNVPAQLSAIEVQIEYKLGTAQWVAATGSQNILTGWESIPIGATASYPFTTAFTFETADGSAPPELSALRLTSKLLTTDPALPPAGPFPGDASLSLPLPAPATLAQAVTVVEQGLASPSSSVEVTGGGTTHQVTESLQIHTGYDVRRLTGDNATLQHVVSIPQLGMAVAGATALQLLPGMYAPTLELRELEPRVTHTQDDIPLQAVMRVRAGDGLDLAQLRLVELDASGAVLRTLASFVDDGMNGDPFARDGIFLARGTASWAAAGIKYLAGVATLTTGETLRSETFQLQVADKRTEEEWSLFWSTQRNGAAKFDELLKSHPIAEARSLLLSWLEAQPGVAEALLDDTRTVRILYTSGLQNELAVEEPNPLALGGGSSPASSALSMLTSAPTGALLLQNTRSALLSNALSATPPTLFPRSNKALIVSTAPEIFNQDTGWILVAKHMLEQAGYAVTYLYSTDVTIATHKSFDRYGIIYSVGHGGVVKVTNQNTGVERIMMTVSTGEPKASNESIYRDDLAAGHLTFRVRKAGESPERLESYYARTSFYEVYYQGKKFPNTLFIMGHCLLLGNDVLWPGQQDELANVFLDRGAKGFVGYKGPGLTYSYQVEPDLDAFVRNLTVKRMRFIDAFLAVPMAGVQRPEGNTFTFAAKSNPDVGLVWTSPLNGDFEMGSLVSWDKDRRADAFKVPVGQTIAGWYVAQLGAPVYTQGSCSTSPSQTDAISQVAVVPSDAGRLSFNYLMITCLPANGSFSVKVYDEEKDTLLGTLLAIKYPGYGEPKPELWHSGIQSFSYDLVADPLKLRLRSRKIRLSFQSAQLGTRDQTVYLDNIAFER